MFGKSRLIVDTLCSSYTNFLVMFDIDFALSLTVSEISVNFTLNFWKFSKYWLFWKFRIFVRKFWFFQNFWKFWKILSCVNWQCVCFKIFVWFALSLTVSKIEFFWKFRKILTFLKILKFLIILRCGRDSKFLSISLYL